MEMGFFVYILTIIGEFKKLKQSINFFKKQFTLNPYLPNHFNFIQWNIIGFPFFWVKKR